MSDLEEAVSMLRERLKPGGVTIVASRPIAYGVQLHVADAAETISVNIYNGKKGIRFTVGGSASSPLRQKLCQWVEGGAPDTAPTTVVPAVSSGRAPHGFENVPDFDYRWLGTDESGKGDVFGPLVAAGVFVTRDSAEQLLQAGVKDSKLLTDAKARSIAQTIRTLCAGQYVELELMPERYNALYRQMRAEGQNLNHLLAWAHARVLEDLLGKVPCRFALVDQFADETYIRRKLMTRGRQITLILTHRAERNVAVAAASILARDCFLNRMEELRSQFGMTFPKGASLQVQAAGREFVSHWGKEYLPKVAKMHFKTVEQFSASLQE